MLIVTAVLACGHDSFEGTFVVPDDLYAASAVGSDHLWVSGYFGAVYRTTDGGESWTKLAVPTEKSIYDINFADTRHGWAVGRRGFILHTEDGGDTWSPQELPRKPARHIFSIEAIDKNTVWAVGDWGGRYKTEDGGKTWQDHSFLITEDHPAFKYLNDTEIEEFESGKPVYDDIYLNDVHFLDAERGFMVGEYGMIFRTVDGGETWDRARIKGAVSFDPIPFEVGDAEIGRDLWPPLFAATEILKKKAYLRLKVSSCLTKEELEETGSTILADDRSESLRDFLESEGISQDRIKLVNATPFDEEGIDMEAFRASKTCGEDGPMVTVEVVETPFLFDIKVDERGHGMIAGLGGVLLKTDDFGETWTYMDTKARQAFFAVGLGKNGSIAVGEKGLKRITRDGGRSWATPGDEFPPVVAFMRDAVYGDPLRGWIVGANSLVLRTSDGGLTWEEVPEINNPTVMSVAAGE